MDAVGRLAGGVAHDFNNILTAILSYAELGLEDLRPDDPLAQDLEEIRNAAVRARTLTRQLLAFSRQQVLAPRVLDLNQVVAEIDKMLRRLVGEDIEIAAALAPRLGAIRADPGQIEQVIVNLAVNARDAMPEGGQLTIETAEVELPEATARDLVTVPAGRYVMLAITDTGYGMDPETKSRLFEPFFTTKEPGKGTGLGLATVYGIVNQSGGFVWVYSEPGQGTTVKVYFPRVEEAPQTAPPAAPADAEPQRGSETILLVEDEEAVRTIARLALTRRGYRVLVAANGGEALLAGERETGPIHLLLTDVVMPGMGGPELARRLAALRPAMKLLFMSGYADRAVARHGLIESGARFLEKPFTPESLLRKVRDVLGAGAPAPAP